MKKILIFGTVFLGLNLILNAAPFEGKVEFLIREGKKMPLTFDYLVKGNMIRLENEDSSGEKGVILMDSSQKKMFIIVDKEKKYTEMVIGQTKGTERKKDEKTDFSKTGKKDVILDYPCEQWIAKDQKGTTEIWLAQGLGSFLGFGNSKVKNSQIFWQKEAEKKGLFPLKVISLTNSGKEKSFWKVNKIEKKKIENALFKVPSNYEKTEKGSFKNFIKDFSDTGE